MKLSLSVRIAEGFLSKEHALLSLDELTDVAIAGGYQAICMRASQVSIHSTTAIVGQAAALLRERRLAVSMVTGNFDIVYNNERGPAALRNITPFLDLAEQLGASLIRVALKHADDISWAQRAADEAHERNLRLVHQCHTLSLFETVDSAEQTLKQIGRANFGIIFEPANLQLCGQDFGSETVQRLAPWIFNVYLQNQRIHPNGVVTLDTWCCGPRSFDVIQIHESDGLPFHTVFESLRGIGYDDWITVHQSAPEGTTPGESAMQTGALLRELIT